MYTDELEEQKISIENLFLDPNNPRFWGEKTSRTTPEAKIPETKPQENAFTNLVKYFGIEELKFSILRNGFLPLDRIVVRPISNHQNKFVVVEGNRRLAALKNLREEIDNELIDEEDIDDTYLEMIKNETDNLDVLVYKGSDYGDISWILQGIRHIGGVKDWEPAQKARLVADQIENSHLSFTEAGQKFGLSAQAVGRLYRSYKALLQMFNDDEWGKEAKNSYFSLFEEAIRSKTVREWLEWNEKVKEFENLDNLHTFYRWITKDEEIDPDSIPSQRRIHNPRDVKDLAYLIDGDYKSIIQKIDQGEYDVAFGGQRAKQSEPEKDWIEVLEYAYKEIGSIPQKAIADNPEEYVKKLNNIITTLENYKQAAETFLEK